MKVATYAALPIAGLVLAAITTTIVLAQPPDYSRLERKIDEASAKVDQLLARRHHR